MVQKLFSIHPAHNKTTCGKLFIDLSCYNHNIMKTLNRGLASFQGSLLHRREPWNEATSGHFCKGLWLLCTPTHSILLFIQKVYLSKNEYVLFYGITDSCFHGSGIRTITQSIIPFVVCDIVARCNWQESYVSQNCCLMWQFMTTIVLNTKISKWPRVTINMNVISYKSCLQRLGGIGLNAQHRYNWRHQRKAMCMVHRRGKKVAKSFVTVVAGDLVPSAKSGDLLLFQVHLTLPHKSGKKEFLCILFTHLSLKIL